MGDSAALFDGQDDNSDLQFGFNKEFADRLEHNKQREELHRLKERHPELAARLKTKGQHEHIGGPASGSSEDEEEEEEDEGDQPLQTERKFLELLVKIRRRDPSLYTAAEDASISNSSGSSDSDSKDEPAEARRSHRPKYLKDVLADQAMAEVDDDSSEEQDDHAQEGTYVQEQQDLRDAFLQAAEDSAAVPEQSDFGGMLLKTRAQQAAQRQELSQLVDQAYDAKGQLNKDDQFLRSFLLNESWKDKDDREADQQAQEVDLAEDDDDFDQAAEQFEAQYNFRFEEEGADRIRSHPRVPEGTFRRVDDTRKKARDRQIDRRKAQREQHDNEIRRLKRLRRQEIQDKLQQLQEVAGSNAPSLDVMDKLMAGDFDAEQYDAAMDAAFGQDYYEREGEASEPDDLPEDLVDDLPAQSDDADAAARAQGFAALHASLRGRQGGEEASASAQRSAAEVKRLLERYHDLEYEDHVGGIATRFKYQEVPRADYGLEIGELLALPDKELNQVVGLKRLAPYRDDAGLSRPNFGKLRELRALHSSKLARSSAKGNKASKVKQPRMPFAPEEPLAEQAAEQLAAQQPPSADADAAAANESYPAEVDAAEHEAHAKQGGQRPSRLREGDGVVQNGLRKRRRKKGTAGAFGRSTAVGPTDEATEHMPEQGQRNNEGGSPEQSSLHTMPIAKPHVAQGKSVPGKDGTRKRRKTSSLPAAAVHDSNQHAAAEEPVQSQEAADAQALERRRKTYEQPFLVKQPGQSDQSRHKRHKQREADQSPLSGSPVSQQEADGTSGLSKAQKRNARRARIRQEKQADGSRLA